jgi:hypothetical protein
MVCFTFMCCGVKLRHTSSSGVIFILFFHISHRKHTYSMNLGPTSMILN